jgi:hypothetical protein
VEPGTREQRDEDGVHSSPIGAAKEEPIFPIMTSRT